MSECFPTVSGNTQAFLKPSSDCIKNKQTNKISFRKKNQINNHINSLMEIEVKKSPLVRRLDHRCLVLKRLNLDFQDKQ